MELHQTKIVAPDGTILLDDLPFEAGETVKVTVEKTIRIDPSNPYPLRGTPYRYDLPFEPVFPLEDWDPLEDREESK